MVSLNENIAGDWELHPVVERSTLRRSVVNFQGCLDRPMRPLRDRIRRYQASRLAAEGAVMFADLLI